VNFVLGFCGHVHLIQPYKFFNTLSSFHQFSRALIANARFDSPG